MAKKQLINVTMKRSIGEDALEVTGPAAYVEKKIAEFVALHSQAQGGPPTKKPKRRHNKPNAENKAGSVDIMSVVNTLKERENFQFIQERVFNKHDLWDKIRIILQTAKVPMQSGEIAHVLRQLGCKGNQSAVSTKLKKQNVNLHVSGARKKGAILKYKLLARAVSATEKWMHETLK